MIELIAGIGVVCFIMLYLAFQLDKGHYILQLILVLTSVSMLMLIPKTTLENTCAPVINETNSTNGYTTYVYQTYCINSTTMGMADVSFHKGYQRFYYVFWVYIFIYFVYRVLIWMGVIVGGVKNE